MANPFIHADTSPAPAPTTTTEPLRHDLSLTGLVKFDNSFSFSQSGGCIPPPDIKEYPLVQEFRTKLEGLHQLSGASLDEALKAYHDSQPPGFMKAVEKQKAEYEQAEAIYQQRQIDLGLNTLPNEQAQFGKPVFMAEPKPGKILQENELNEARIAAQEEARFEAQARQLIKLMGPGFDQQARSYEERLEQSEPHPPEPPDRDNST